jgi:hypothetical protein
MQPVWSGFSHAPLTGTPGVAAPATANLGTLYPSADLKTAAIAAGKVTSRISDGSAGSPKLCQLRMQPVWSGFSHAGRPMADPNRPLILAGHSQGGLHLSRLLTDRVAKDPALKRCRTRRGSATGRQARRSSAS